MINKFTKKRIYSLYKIYSCYIDSDNMRMLLFISEKQ